MTAHIKAKPTLYKGTRFRSRLEARWAAFFDALGREWIYEPQLPELAGMNYQPDFLIDGWKGGTTLVEVKPWVLTDSRWVKTINDDRWKRIAAKTQCPFTVLMGQPGKWVEGVLTDGGHFAIIWRPDGSSMYAEWAECSKCELVALWEDGFARCCFPPLPTGPLHRAYGAVRDMSFEDPA